MAVYNYAGGEINVKVVYYGPGVSGKTTNLEHMYSKLPKESKGKMVSMKTRTDRTLFFDFLPIEIGDFKGMKVRFLLYTVPGQVYYNATRRLVLKGVDAVVFVADSTPGKMDENIESLNNLEENLNELCLSLNSIPWVMQYNKRDVDGCVSREVLDAELNTWDAEVFESVATTGKGVYETFKGIARKIFESMKNDLNESSIREKVQDDDEPSEEISAEVVAQGVSRNKNSEADESESLGYAEEREEEHKSVSEFVDDVLKEEKLMENGADQGVAGEGYEEYGHVVELCGDNRNEEEKLSEEDRSDPPEAEENDNFITNSVENLSDNDTENTASEPEDLNVKPAPSFEKYVTVPLELTEDDIKNSVPVKVVFEIKVRS
ncbi:MAG: hypothetical protein JW746_02275 [Candidatus Krumholzibacteriota bacterium]|nr:hypothetical protein [Candidatus Krumholzibacteriota bacterium]